MNGFKLVIEATKLMSVEENFRENTEIQWGKLIFIQQIEALQECL